jgi:thiol-disulfide isomerase/thioredoxin
MDKGKLKKLNQLVARLAAEPGNEWMADDLLKQISLRSDTDAQGLHPILLHIHEQCIEENIKTQADEFYKDFPFEEIRPQMIGYMIKMEHERRRGDFEGFCLAMFQQFECLGNHAFNQKWIRNKILESKNRFSFQLYNKDKKAFEEAKAGDELIALLLNRFDVPTKTYSLSNFERDKYFEESGDLVSQYSSGKNTWGILPKIKMALYLFYFDEKMEKGDFLDLKGFLDEIYAARNKVHPEIKPNDRAKKTLEQVLSNTSVSMTRFYGYLSKIMSGLTLDPKFVNSSSNTENKIFYSSKIDLQGGKAPKLGDKKKVIMDLDAIKQRNKKR